MFLQTLTEFFQAVVHSSWRRYWRKYINSPLKKKKINLGFLPLPGHMSIWGFMLDAVTAEYCKVIQTVKCTLGGLSVSNICSMLHKEFDYFVLPYPLDDKLIQNQTGGKNEKSGVVQHSSISQSHRTFPVSWQNPYAATETTYTTSAY